MPCERWCCLNASFGCSILERSASLECYRLRAWHTEIELIISIKNVKGRLPITRPMTRSRCLKPSVFKTLRFISSSKCLQLNSIRMQFKPKLAKYFASPSVKKYSSHLSKKKLYFAWPRTWSIAARWGVSCPGKPVTKFSMLFELLVTSPNKGRGTE